MLLAFHTPFPQHRLRLFTGLLLFVLVAGALLIFEQTAMRVVCGAILYFVLPGYFVMLALLPEEAWLERVVLMISISTALSTLCVLAIILFVPGLLTYAQVGPALCGLILLTFGLALYRCLRNPQQNNIPPVDANSDTNPDKSCGRWWWLALLLILLLAAALRLVYLDHAELQDDEIDITKVAVRILRGEDQVIFQDRRGPAQTVITAVAYLFGERPSEWILRLPATIPALATLVGMIALASRLFNRWIGLFSGLLLSLDGFVFAYSRIVQMQSTLLLMMVAAVLCFYQLYRRTAVVPVPATTEYSRESQRLAVTYQTLGTLFFGFGMLAHYEMALLAPVLLFLYFVKYGRLFWQRDKLGVLIAASVLLLTTGAFYLAFILNPAFDETLNYYRDDIVGRNLHNNSAQLIVTGLFYNSIYLFATLYLGATVALVVQLRLALHRLKPLTFVLLLLAFLFGVGFGVGLLSSVWGGALSNGLLLAAALVIAACCIVPARLPIATRLLFLWLACYFIPYLFLLREVHIHYYAFSPPLAVLAVVGWNQLYKKLFEKIGGGERREGAGQQGVRRFYALAWIGAGGLVVILSAYYLFLVFVQPMPEYALNFPNNKHPLYPTPYSVRHGEAFGFAHRSGWQTVAWLYRSGVLRGSFETNELWLKAQWYTQWQAAGEQPRYYLVADLPHRLQASPWPTPFVAADYHLWGVVTVRQQPRLHIYQRNTFPAPEQVATWADEESAAKLDQAQTLDELYRAELYQADQAFYAQAAQQLMGKPETGLLFYAPEQAAHFSLYDQSTRRYYLPDIATGIEPLPVQPLWLAQLPVPLVARQNIIEPQAQSHLLEQIIGQERHLYALYWGVDPLAQQANLHTWLNQQLFPVSTEWIGNLQLVYYDVPSVALAATLEPLSWLPQPRQNIIGERHHLKLGQAIQLEGYTLQPPEKLAGNLHLSLFWRAVEPVAESYKVFVHLLDESNTLVSQQDSEPVGGQRPTHTWPVSAGEATESTGLIRDNRAIPLPAGLQQLSGYKLAVGMYSPRSGERLPIYEQDGTQLPNAMLVIELD